MEPKHISPRALLLWRVRLCVAALVLSFLISLIMEIFSTVWFVFTGLLAVAFLFFYVFYYPVKYKKLTYAVGKGVLVLHGGVFYRRRRSIFLKNIQYIALFETPFSRILGLKDLIVHAAGGTLYLPGLEEQTCALLEKLLMPEDGEGQP